MGRSLFRDGEPFFAFVGRLTFGESPELLEGPQDSTTCFSPIPTRRYFTILLAEEAKKLWAQLVCV